MPRGKKAKRNLTQLENLVEVISRKYKDKDIESRDKIDFEYVVKDLKESINEFREIPLEELFLSKHTIREFLERLDP